jgi:hypothetical protein
MTSIAKRNQQILQMQKEGFSIRDVAERFNLSPSRIDQIAKRDATERSMAERRAKLSEEIRTTDDPERMWAVIDLADALGLLIPTKNRLVEHFTVAGRQQIRLRELMDMCILVEKRDPMLPPLLKVCGVGKKGFWSVVNGLTGMDLGRRCNEEWKQRLIKIKQEQW